MYDHLFNYGTTNNQISFQACRKQEIPNPVTFNILVTTFIGL